MIFLTVSLYAAALAPRQPPTWPAEPSAETRQSGGTKAPVQETDAEKTRKLAELKRLLDMLRKHPPPPPPGKPPAPR